MGSPQHLRVLERKLRELEKEQKEYSEKQKKITHEKRDFQLQISKLKKNINKGKIDVGKLVPVDPNADPVLFLLFICPLFLSLPFFVLY